MSTWMNIGFDPDQFDPDQMDPAPERNTQAAMGGARDEVAPRQADGLGQATLSGPGPVNGLKDSSTHWIAGALKHLVARHRAPAVPDWTL
jgi:hypothetical protein